jgi:hypothetical protein
MANITTALLDFLMDLLKSPQAGADFAADPDTALQNAGLQGICAADVDAVLPVALDFGPVGNREYETGGNSIGGNATSGITGGSASNAGGGGWGGGESSSSGGGGGWGGGGNGGGGGGGAEYAAAKAKLVSVVNNYSYLDDRDVVNDQSVNQNIGIVAGDDVEFDQDFENESTTITGDGNIVAGGSVAAGNTEYNLDLEIEDSFNEETEIDIEDSFNDNSDNSTNTVIEVEDSFNEETEIEDSFNDDHSTEVDIEDSFNDNSTEVDIEDSFNEETEIEDSFNVDASVDASVDNSIDNSIENEDSFNDNSTEVEVEIEDSFNEDNSVDNSVEVEDSFNEETEVEVEVEDSFNEDSYNDEVEIEESIVVVAEPEVEVLP